MVAADHGFGVGRAVEDDTEIHTDFGEAVDCDFASAGGPAAEGEVAVGYGLLAGEGEVFIHLLENPGGACLVVEYAGDPFPVDEVFGAFALEVAVAIVGVAVGGVGAPHVVVAVGPVYYGGVVDIGEVPFGAVGPSGD